MERRDAHGVETIAPPQEVKRASSKACHAKNLQVDREYSLVVGGRAAVSSQPKSDLPVRDLPAPEKDTHSCAMNTKSGLMSME